eukprot:COSAG02_NODE_58460_length_277_cov_0.758427_1_plen_39_part_10
MILRPSTQGGGAWEAESSGPPSQSIQMKQGVRGNKAFIG